MSIDDFVDVQVVTTRQCNQLKRQRPSPSSKSMLSTKFFETYDEIYFIAGIHPTHFCKHYFIPKIPIWLMVKDINKVTLVNENSKKKIMVNSLESNVIIDQLGLA